MMVGEYLAVVLLVVVCEEWVAVFLVVAGFMTSNIMMGAGFTTAKVRVVLDGFTTAKVGMALAGFTTTKVGVDGERL